MPTSIDLNQYSPGILNGNTGFTITYHYSANDALTGNNPITAPVNVNNSNTVYYYSIVAANSTCRQTGSFKFVLSPPANNTTLSKCSTDGSNTAVFNLNQAQPAITNQPGVTFRFYTNLPDAISNNNNFITNPTNYTSGNTNLFVRIVETGCIAQLTLIVNSISTPTITSSSSTICFGGNVTLSTNATSGILWSTGETTPSINVTTPGTYTVTYNDGTCTSAPASITINAEADPNLTISGNNSFCTGTSTTLTANSSLTGGSYQWSTGATTPIITITNAGTYSVTYTSVTGCSYQTSVNVTETPLPTANATTLSLCSTTGSATFNLTTAETSINGAPGVTYTYYQNLADAQANNTNNITNPTAYTSGATTLYVVVNNGTCKAIANLTLEIISTAAPTITASSTSICYGGSVTLTSSNVNGNTWSTGETTQTITVTTPGTYTVNYNDGTCTSAPASITISAESNPNLNITGDLSFCTGTSTQITANSNVTGGTYTWSTGATTPSITVTAGGSYTVTLTTPSGCTYQQSVNITENPLPTANTTTLSQCSNLGTATFNLTDAEVNINGGAGVTYTYYQTLADAQANNTNNITNITTYNSAPTTLYVLVDNGVCKNIATLILDIVSNTPPTITASSTTICFGGSVTLTSSNATGNLWSTGETTPSIIVSTPGTYTVLNNTANCPSNPASITLTAENDPNIQITGNLSFCGTSTTLTATSNNPANTYSWSNGSTTATTQATASGTYTVTASTPSGCTYQKSVVVNKEQDIVINIATPQTLTCNVTQVTINANNSNYPANSTFAWTASAGGNILSGQNTLTPTVNSAGTYTLTITSPMGCQSAASVNVIADTTPPVVSLNAASLTICEGDTITLTASGAATYSWGHTNSTTATQTVSPTTTTTYTVSGIGNNGCNSANTAEITITVVPQITSTLTDIDFCNSDVPILDAGSGVDYTYLWSTGETTQSIVVTAPGTYTVTISNGACTKTFSAHAYMNIPTINEITFENDILTIHATGDAGLVLEYSIDNGFNWQTSNSFPNVTRNTTITVLVRYKDSNCWDTQEYYTLFVPNVITPNGDGVNDTIDFTTLANTEGFKGAIYDRYGRAVFTPTKQNTVWNGTYLGRSLPTATYWYNFSWEDPLSKKIINRTGWIMIKNRD